LDTRTWISSRHDDHRATQDDDGREHHRRSAETVKSPKDAKGEKDGVIELGYFIAGEAELPRVLEAVA
jgi:hypothetical protein